MLSTVVTISYIKSSDLIYLINICILLLISPYFSKFFKIPKGTEDLSSSSYEIRKLERTFGLSESLWLLQIIIPQRGQLWVLFAKQKHGLFNYKTRPEVQKVNFKRIQNAKIFHSGINLIFQDSALSIKIAQEESICFYLVCCFFLPVVNSANLLFSYV